MMQRPLEPLTKRCSRCKKEHAVEDFTLIGYAVDRTTPRYHAHCNYCRRIYARKYHQENRDICNLKRAERKRLTGK